MGRNMAKDEWDSLEIDCEGENKFASFFLNTCNMHSYPARAVPEMVNSILKKLVEEYKIKSVMDPFLGSGTIALEAKYLGLDFFGSDLNPLAILLSKTKVLQITNTPYIKETLIEFSNYIKDDYKTKKIVPLHTFKNIDYWFKENNIRELSYLRNEIDKFLLYQKEFKDTYALILLTAFSSTIRRSSLTRSGEFKLYRISPNDIEKFNVNSIETFKERIQGLLDMLVIAGDSCNNDAVSEIFLQNAKDLSYMENKKVDLVMTSPPYGDSKTTVAYGQFSRLSLQWMKELFIKYLGIYYKDENCDEYLLGGSKSQFNHKDEEWIFKSKTLVKLVKNVDKLIASELKDKKGVRRDLTKLEKAVDKFDFISVKKIILKNPTLYNLISERVRLDIYRILNNKKVHLSNKQIKASAKKQRDAFMKTIVNGNSKSMYRKLLQLKDKLRFINDTIERKCAALPTRKEEIISFFMDLYEVVLETDRVLESGGIQTWIVGHRTIFEKLNVNMEGIIREWFEAMGYTTIRTLKRKYSFKRLPNHINSTISRNKKVQTMMYEYILIVKKCNIKNLSSF